MVYLLTVDQITAFGDHLHIEEREPSTIEKYLHNIRVFAVWLGNAPVTKAAVIAWKEHLISERYAPTTVNATVEAAQCGKVEISRKGKIRTIMLHREHGEKRAQKAKLSIFLF